MERKQKISFRILILSTVLTGILLTTFCIMQAKDAHFVPVHAKFIGCVTEAPEGSNMHINYEEFSYNYEGQEYTSKRQTLFKSDKNINKMKIIKINPDNPMQIKHVLRDKFIIFCAVICVLLGVIVYKPALDYRRKKNKN